jgi:hypothetical protein
VAIDAAVVPPMMESWELVELKIFVQYGPLAGATCRPKTLNPKPGALVNPAVNAEGP